MDSLQFYSTRVRYSERGVVVKRYDLMHYDVLIPGRAHPWGEISPMEPTFFEVGEVVDLGFIEGQALPVILNRKPWIVPGLPGGLVAIGWPTFRQSYGRGSRIAGMIAGAWSVEADLHPTIIRWAEGGRWERRGSSGLWSSDPPWQLFRDGVEVGASNSLLWHDLSILAGSAVGLIAEEENSKWFFDPDYPLPNETSAIGIGSVVVPLPNYQDDGGGDDGGGDDGGGGIIIG